MEDRNSSDQASSSSTSFSDQLQPAPVKQSKSLILPLMLVLFLTGAIFGSVGYYHGLQVSYKIQQERKPSEAKLQNTLNQQTAESPIATPGEIKEFKTYESKFLSFNYPSRLFIWSFGRGISLDFFQLNSVSEEDQENPDKVMFTFDIQTLSYTEGESIEDQRQHIERIQKQNSEDNYVIANRTIDGVPALIYERTIANLPSYSKSVWFIKNDAKYIITMHVVGSTPGLRDELKSEYSSDFDSILDSISLKQVDLSETKNININGY